MRTLMLFPPVDTGAPINKGGGASLTLSLPSLALAKPSRALAAFSRGVAMRFIDVADPLFSGILRVLPKLGRAATFFFEELFFELRLEEELFYGMLGVELKK